MSAVVVVRVRLLSAWYLLLTVVEQLSGLGIEHLTGVGNAVTTGYYAHGGATVAVRTAGGGLGKAGKAAEEAAKAGKVAAEGAGASVPVAKFSDYIFREGATHGKDAVFRSYGFGAADSQALASEFERQGATKFAAGDYQLGKLDQYGQRITTSIGLRGQGAAASRTAQINSGMIRSDG